MSTVVNGRVVNGRQQVRRNLRSTIKANNASASPSAADETPWRAFVRSLEVIGEAVKSLPEEFLESHPEVDWRPIARMRDRLIHGYFGVDYQLVWDVCRRSFQN